jgi:hypothetical protein
MFRPLMKFLAVICFLLCSCTQFYWDKPGFNQEEFYRDSYECERDRRQSYFDEDEKYFAQNQFQDLCMRAKGYSKFER